MLRLSSLHGKRIHLVGIKGSGMLSLAEFLQKRSAILSGSDVNEQFVGDSTLTELKIPYAKGFSHENIPANTELVIYSRAWDSPEHPEIRFARKQNIPLMSYNEALGELSQQRYTAAISGTHGKTSICAMTSSLVHELQCPGTVLCGGPMINFANRGLFDGGDELLLLEACEYKKHFLNLHPNIILISNIEWEHPDFYPNRDAVVSAFADFVHTLPQDSVLIHSSEIEASFLHKLQKDLQIFSYGRDNNCTYHISEEREKKGRTDFKINGMPMTLHQPGQHLVENVAGAVALLDCIRQIRGDLPYDPALIQRAIKNYQGVRRRSEILGTQNDIIFVDDYGHHPSAISKTLEAYKKFFQPKRIIVDFMPHTHSRSKELLEDFVHCFNTADALILNDIYSSARETEEDYDIDGVKFAEAVGKAHPSVHYEPDFNKAATYAANLLQKGDLFVSMGAGNNWKITEQLIQRNDICTE